MKVQDVANVDCKAVAQLINMLNVSEYTANGKDICAAADSIRWLQSFAIEMAKSYQEQLNPKPTAAPDTAAVAPVEGFKVKSYNPGKVGKK